MNYARRGYLFQASWLVYG